LGFDLGVTIILSRRRGRAQHRDALVLARLAALRFVLELLVVEEKLLPGGKDKFASTVHTLQHLVLKLH